LVNDIKEVSFYTIFEKQKTCGYLAKLDV
jgi:hypothetical protein